MMKKPTDKAATSHARRRKRLTCLVNERENEIIDNYLKRCKIKNKSTTLKGYGREKTSDLPCNVAEKLRPNFPYASGTVCWLPRRREVFSLRFFNFLLTKIVVSGML